MSENVFLTASEVYASLYAAEAYASLYDWSGKLVTIFNYDNVCHDEPDPFSADEPDMTGVCE